MRCMESLETAYSPGSVGLFDSVVLFVLLDNMLHLCSETMWTHVTSQCIEALAGGSMCQDVVTILMIAGLSFNA